jgi:hypothetical protein
VLSRPYSQRHLFAPGPPCPPPGKVYRLPPPNTSVYESDDDWEDPLPGTLSLEKFLTSPQQDKRSESLKDKGVRSSLVAWLNSFEEEPETYQEDWAILPLIVLSVSQTVPLPEEDAEEALNWFLPLPPPPTLQEAPLPPTSSDVFATTSRSQTPEDTQTRPEFELSPLGPQIQGSGRSLWETLPHKRQQQLREAFTLIHGTTGVTPADILNWWNELSLEEQQEILQPPPPETPQPTCPRCDGPHTIESCPLYQQDQTPRPSSDPVTPTPTRTRPRLSFRTPPLHIRTPSTTLFGGPSEFFTASLEAAQTATMAESSKGKQRATSEPGTPVQPHTAATDEPTTNYPNPNTSALGSSPPHPSGSAWQRASGLKTNPPPIPWSSKPKFASLFAPPKFLTQAPVPPPAPGNQFIPPNAPSNNDKWLEMPKPFEYDGSYALWDDWQSKVETYFLVNAHRFRSAWHAIGEIASYTKPASRAADLVSALTRSAQIPNSTEWFEFQQISEPLQVSSWILGHLAPSCSDPLKSEKALATVQKPQGTRNIATYLAHMDKARLSLGWTHQQLLAWLLVGINKETLFQIASRCSKTAYSLSWAEIELWGPHVEAENKWRHDPAPPRPTRANAAQIASVSVPVHPPQQEKTFKCQVTNRSPAYAKVPSNLRGPIYHSARLSPEELAKAEARNKAIRDQNRCECCRCFQSDHKAGTRFQPAKPFVARPLALTAAPAVPSRPGSPAPSQSSRIEELD